MFTVTPVERAAGQVRFGVDYGGFAEAYGGNYGARLQLVRLPGCALTTPHLARCRQATPLSSSNNTKTRTVSAPVTLEPSAASAGQLVLAAVASSGEDGSDGGSYAATDLKPSGSWSGGGSTGSFTYAHPIPLPPAASSLAPNAALAYDSGSVDGQTVTTQAQASWVGDGWSTPRSYIEQTFVSCADEPGGSPAPEPTADRCYNGPILSMSLNGATTALVWDNGTWRPQAEDGSVITHVVDSDNGSGTYNNDYWKVTARDGTVYEFGRNRLPGWSSGKAVTNSVDKSPVYSPHSDDPCYNSSGFAASVCDMAYRWNLDYVADVRGNAMAYYYKQDINNYGRNEGAVKDDYVRDSYLNRIDFGFRAGGAYGTVPNRVVFGTGPRCVATTCTPLNDTTKANWPDVPYDLICTTAATCNAWSPTFFSTVRLTSITTQQWDTATSAYVPVDSYALTHTIPASDGNSPTLWLNSITRTGHDTTAGGSTAAITLPSVSFTSIKLPNRVDPAGLTAFYRHRIESITTESGSVITASYERPQPCTAPVTLTPATNTKSCYPVYWTPDGFTDPFLDWFHKYAVTRVTATDPTGGAPATSTNYAYVGGAAWRYDENEVVKKKYRTYGQFRGYGTVKTLNGDGVNDPQTLSVSSYYRGMSKNNSSTVVNVTDSAGGVHEDLNQLAGKELETTAHLGNGGPVDNSTITSYWVSPATATRARTGLPALTAHWVAAALTYSRQAVTSGGSTTWRYTATDSTIDTNLTSATVGLPKHTYTHTVPANAAYDQCTSYTYAPVNTGKNLVGLASQVETVSVACGGYIAGSPASEPGSLNTLTAPTSVNRPAQVVSVERNFYDDPAWSTTFPQTAAPTAGNLTMTRKASNYTSGAYIWHTTARANHDSYGRPLDAYDGNGNQTTTTYTTSSIGLTTATTVAKPLGHTSSTTLNTRRGLTLTTTDPNSVVTTRQYDALGRATAIWLHSRPASSSANYKFSYLVQKNGITAATTQQLNDSAGYITTTKIYDAQLRVRQTQSLTPQSGRLIIDTFYDTRGWTRATNNGWWDPATTPNTTPIQPSQVSPVPSIPNQSFYSYDGLGRQVIAVAAKNGVEVSRTTTAYNGDRTTTIPPDGGVTRTNVTDLLGRTSQLIEYKTAPTLNTPANTFTSPFTISGGTAVTSSFGYDGHGNQHQITDAASATWTSTYNLLGQVTAKTDPDAGAATGMTYDGNGNLVQSTDSRGRTTSTTYDALNRKTGQYAAAVTAQSSTNQLAAWVYDNANNAVANMQYPKGQLTTATAYSGGNAYTVQQRTFNVFGKSLGQTITIPAAEGLLAGTYTFSNVYTTTTGLLGRTVFPSRGGLPAEAVNYFYASAFDLPSVVGGLAGYADGTSYDAWGRVNQLTIGASPNWAYLTNLYDDHTSRLTQQLLTRAVATPAEVDKQNYTYDKAGNITRQTSTHNGSPSTAETQCYQYDKLQRLTQAWTATDTCTTTPTETNRGMVGSSFGTLSTYWTSWEHDVLGNRTKQTQYSTTGSADTTTTYTYDGNGAGQPHTLTGTSTTGATTGSTSYGYDTAGNMTTRNAGNGTQTLNWNDASQLVGITGSTDGDSTFLYDADGNLLLQKDPTTSTLYLPGQQLTLNTTTQAVTGVRYYPLPGGAVTAVRTGTGTNYRFAIANHQGTPALYLDHTAQTPAWRQYTPHGGPRGIAAIAPDNRGFLNKPLNTSTGLTHIGARNYDPTTGRFISVDPILNLDYPQRWNGYSYAASNPITFSDPSGLDPGGGQCAETKNGCSSTWGQVPYLPAPPKPAPPPGSPTTGDRNLEDQRNRGKNAFVTTFTDDFYACKGTGGVCERMRHQVLDKNFDPNRATIHVLCADDAECINTFYSKGASLEALLTILGFFPVIGEPADALAGVIAISKGDWEGAALSFASMIVGVGILAGAARLSRLGKACSFSADTRVLMADGTAKAIKDVKVGDVVLATDPMTGEQGPRQVTHLWVHEDQLIDLRLLAGNTITTTEDHPFWNHTDRQWQQAQQLDLGDLLRTNTGATLPVAGIDWHTAHVAAAYNLTVSDIHTYYVIVGETPVLVHNTDGCTISGSADGQKLADQLRMESATSLFTPSGGLTSQAISESRLIIRGNDLGNQQLRAHLTGDGSDIADWGKYTTRSHQSPYGDFQVHFYYNSRSGAVAYDYDYKAVMNAR